MKNRAPPKKVDLNMKHFIINFKNKYKQMKNYLIKV